MNKISKAKMRIDINRGKHVLYPNLRDVPKDIREIVVTFDQLLESYRSEIDELHTVIGQLNRKIDYLQGVDITKEKENKSKEERYSSDMGDGMDFLDESYITDSFQDFTASIFWTIRKYMKRFGKKDDIVSEATKIADYSNRFLEFCKDHTSKQDQEKKND